MAYIYLEELEKILPGILDQWIDKDDESWEWIFQEIEQKCHVGAKRKDKKWKKHIEDDVSALKEYVDIHKEDICDLNDWYKKLNERVDTLSNKLSNFSVRINNMDHDIAAAKQRTEVDYSKYSGKSDGKIGYSEPRCCATCKYGGTGSDVCIGCGYELGHDIIQNMIDGISGLGGEKDGTDRKTT